MAFLATRASEDVLTNDGRVQHGAWLTHRPPTMQGDAGTAWAITLRPRTLDETACVVGWLLYMRGAHPVWHYWCLSVVHLRAIDGVKPAVKHHDDATHELVVVALSPDHAPPDPTDWLDMRYLTPIDQCVQFTVPDDAAAALMLEGAVRACCDGRLSPDQDYRAYWREIIAETAAHARGEHGE